MAGHSKWANVKHKKAALDAKRGKLFTKLVREITVSARLGGGDPGANPRLRSAIQEAKTSNVPADNIDRAIKKGTGELEGAMVEEVAYEGYAPGGVAVLVEAFTDNRNRTTGDVRHLFSRFGGNLGEAGCVNWMFTKRGYFAFPENSLSEEEFMELAVDLGAEDFSIDSGLELYTSLEDYIQIRETLERRGLETEVAILAMVPQSSVEIDESSLGSVLRLLDALEEHDDVQNVWANFEADEETLARVAESA